MARIVWITHTCPKCGATATAGTRHQVSHVCRKNNNRQTVFKPNPTPPQEEPNVVQG